jgi:hypothetical protein
LVAVATAPRVWASPLIAQRTIDAPRVAMGGASLTFNIGQAEV